MKLSVAGTYECSDCKRRLQPGHFMAVIGRAPKDGLSMPMGRADAIFKNTGAIYCDVCFSKRWREITSIE